MDDDTCPLCVEEFDLSDKNFKPCPCGYQVCQFCYNNIKTNMNGLCPACRRPYDDKTIEWKMVSPEDFKADVAAQAKKKAAARQKEAERKQVETLNRKHLAGLRVLQKNLVYVVGMDISGDEHALETLRGPNHFGQYGDIIKVVASKAKEGYAGHTSTGIYVTFASKDDAKTCIQAIDGTLHDNRVLRAQYGTTKYCSAFLRNERCTNRGCMFLHETGEDGDSFSRADLSSLNAASTQRLAPSASNAGSSKQANPTSAHAQSSQSTAIPSLAQASTSQAIKTEAMSRSDSGDGPALPSTANWAKNPQVEQSRRSSQAASRATPSPKTAQTKMVLPRPESQAARPPSTAPSESKSKVPQEPTSMASGSSSSSISKSAYPTSLARLADAIKTVSSADFSWSLDRSLYDQETLKLIDNFPTLIDPKGGVTLQRRKQQEKERQKEEEEKLEQPLDMPEDEENFAGGSLQLGGEPDNGDDVLGPTNNSRRQTPFGLYSGESQPFDRQASIGSELSNLGLTGRSLTPQQQQNISLLKSGAQQHESILDQPQRAPSGNASQHHSQLSNPFQSQNQQLSALSRHGRQASRYNFANNSSSASTAIKPATNAQLMAQQSAMMPHTQQKNFSSQQGSQPGLHSNFYSGVQGPPPGLKASGTPPISGGGMFGQGHGFASAMAGGANFNSNVGSRTNEENMRDLMRGKMTGGNNIGADTGKHDIDDDTTTQPDRKLPMQQQPPIAAPKAEAFSGSAAPPGLLPADFPPLATPSKPNLDSKGGSIPPVAADPHDISPESIVNPVSDASDFVTSVLPKRRKDESSLEDQRPSQKSLNKQTMDAESIQSSSKVDSKALGHSRQRSEPSVSAKHAQANLRSTSKTDSSATKTPKEVKSSGKQASKITVKEPIRSPTTGLDNPPQQDTPVSLDQITPVKPSASSTALDSPRPSSSGTSTSQQTTTSLPRNPRTLRLVPTTKIDVPQKPPMPVPEDNSSISIGARQASQQPSSASAKQPSTPINDFISDNASLTSASLSRPPSPPGTKGNTTPTSQKSKSQAKKERQARAKKLEETKFTEESTSSPVQEEVVQAPIIGRKKKSKKPQVTPAVAKLVDSEVSSPQVQEFSTKGKKEEEVKAAAVQPNKALEKKTTKLEEPEAEDVVLEPISVPAARPTINSASIFPELKKAGVATSRELDLFLNPTGLNSRFETHVRPDFKYEDLVSLTDLDKQVLDRGECITKKVGRLEYVVVLSDRSVLRHFSREEAQRYVDLRRECYASLASTFTSPEFPIDAWLNFTSNDLLSGYQVAPLLDSSDDEASLGSPEALVKEYGAGIMRPDSKDAQYASLYPPRTQSENDEIEARMTMMTVEEAEQTLKASEELLLATKKEAEQVEKKLQQTLKKNRKILKDFL